MLGTKDVASVSCMLIFGALGSIFSKAVYKSQGEDFDGHSKYFRKPWLTTSLMFVACAICLPITWVKVCVEKRKRRVHSGTNDGQEPLLSNQANAHDGSKKQHNRFGVFILVVPMLFDLAATLLQSIGLLYVAASIYQMLRGSEMLFSALFGVTLLKRHLNRLHYLGLLLCMAGIALVGASSLLSPGGSQSADPKQVLMGMVLIVLSQAVSAAQVTMEDYSLQHLDIEPLEVVGYEGLFGTIVSFGVLLPIVYFLPGKEGEGIHEDSLESWHMIANSLPWWAVPTVLVANSLALLFYNIGGIFVTEDLGAVSRTVFESARTLLVWLGDLLLYYTPLGFGRLGEDWNRSSYLQAVGFAVLVAGTLVYGRGDQREEAELKAAHAPYGPLMPNRRRFRFFHNIFTPSHTAARHRGWRKKIADAVHPQHGSGNA